MNAKRELEIRGIIDKNGKHINEPCPYHSEGQECAMCEGTGLIYKGTIVDRERLADAILSKLPELGYVRLEDIEIDVNKLKESIPHLYESLELVEGVKMQYLGAYILKWKDNMYPKGGATIGFGEIDREKLAATIYQTKGILKIKEAKNEKTEKRG